MDVLFFIFWGNFSSSFILATTDSQIERIELDFLFLFFFFFFLFRLYIGGEEGDFSMIKLLLFFVFLRNLWRVREMWG